MFLEHELNVTIHRSSVRRGSGQDRGAGQVQGRGAGRDGGRTRGGSSGRARVEAARDSVARSAGIEGKASNGFVIVTKPITL